MKSLLLILAVVLLNGCGSESKSDPKQTYYQGQFDKWIDSCKYWGCRYDCTTDELEKAKIFWGAYSYSIDSMKKYSDLMYPPEPPRPKPSCDCK